MLGQHDARHPGADDDGVAISAGYFARMVPTRDIREAIDAFLEKRRVVFTGS